MKKRIIVGIVSAVLLAAGFNLLGVLIDIAAFSRHGSALDRR